MDRSVLTANSDLWRSLAAAIDDSEFFILLACPASASSHWVAREIDYWLQRRGTDNIIICLTEGERPRWDDARGCYPETTTVLPRSLLTAFTGEPLFVDLTGQRAQGPLDLDTPSFYERVAFIAGRLRGYELDEMIGVDRDRRRQLRRVITGTIAVLSVLLVLAVTLAVVALHQTGIAQRERAQAQQQRDLAVRRQVTAIADGIRAGDGSVAAQLDLVAYRMGGSPDLYARLLQSENAVLGRTLTGHTGGVLSVALSPDGRTLASAGDVTTRLWDVADPSRPASLGGPVETWDDLVITAAFSPDGKILASAGYDGTIRLTGLADPSHPLRVGTPVPTGMNEVTRLAFSPDGRLLAAVGMDKTIRMWNVSNPSRPTRVGQPVRAHTDGVSWVVFSPDGRLLASAGFDNRIRLWSVAANGRIRALSSIDQGTPQISVAFSPDGRTIASGGQDGDLRLNDVSRPNSPQPIGTPMSGHTTLITAVAFSPDGSLVGTASLDRTVRLWNVTDLADPYAFGTPIGHPDGVWSLAFSRDGETLVTSGNDWMVHVWSLPRTRVPGPATAVQAVAFGPRRTMLAAGDSKGAISVWNTTDTVRPSLIARRTGAHRGQILRIAFSPDGRTLATAGADGTVRLWNLTDPATPVAWRDPLTVGGGKEIWALAFSPGGETLAVGDSRGRVTLWDVAAPAAARPIGAYLQGPERGIGALTFARDGRVLVAAGTSDRAGAVQLWDVSDPARPDPLGVPLYDETATSFNTVTVTGNIMASAGGADGIIRLWDIAEPASPRQLPTIRGNAKSVHDLAFSPDGQMLAGASYGEVRLWDVTDPARPVSLGVIGGHTERVRTVAFSPDGQSLATGGFDRTILLWNLDADAAARRLCRATGSLLTPRLWQEYVSEQRTHQPPCV